MTDFTNGTSDYKLTEPQMALLRVDVPVIDIVGEVNPAMYGYVRTAIRYLLTRGSPDVKVLITSPGGHVEAGLDIYDELRLYTGKKEATVNDNAASMGALILQACDVRRCAKHSHVLIHHISGGRITLDTLRSKKKTKKMRDRMERDQKRLYDILAERTGKKVKDIRRACARDQYMNAADALKFGLVDEIV